MGDVKCMLNLRNTAPEISQICSKKKKDCVGLQWWFRSKESACMQETWVQPLGQEDPLEKGVGTYSIILAWRIPWTEEPRGLQSTGSQRVGHN